MGVVEAGGRFGCVGRFTFKNWFPSPFHAAQFDELSCIIDFWRLVLALRPMSPQSSHVPPGFWGGVPGGAFGSPWRYESGLRDSPKQPQGDTRWSQNGTEWFATPQDALKMAQDVLKTPQNGSKIAQSGIPCRFLRILKDSTHEWRDCFIGYSWGSGEIGCWGGLLG